MARYWCQKQSNWRGKYRRIFCITPSAVFTQRADEDLGVTNEYSFIGEPDIDSIAVGKTVDEFVISARGDKKVRRCTGQEGRAVAVALRPAPGSGSCGIRPDGSSTLRQQPRCHRWFQEAEVDDWWDWAGDVWFWAICWCAAVPPPCSPADVWAASVWCRASSNRYGSCARCGRRC